MLKIRIFSAILLCVITAQNVCGQINATISFLKREISVQNYLIELQEIYSVRLYCHTLAKDILLDRVIKSDVLEDALDFLSTETNLHVYRYSELVYIITPINMNTASLVQAKNEYRVTGRIIDAVSGDYIPYAVLFIEELNESFSADANGNFSILLPDGLYSIKVSSLGNFENNFDISLRNDLRMEIELYKKTIQLDEVTITYQNLDHNLKSLEASSIEMNIDAIKKIPAFLGEVDINRVMVSLPGVTTVGEGATGFNVRGGNIDQNLILFDGIPIYNTGHLLGFFSVFNADMISDFKLHKGNIPSNYGGRISSVLHVNQKIPNKEKFKFSTSIGPINSKLFFDIPLVEKRSGIIFGGRAAYPNYIIKSFPEENGVDKSRAAYYDVNVKFDQLIGENSSVSITSNLSSDEFSLASDTTFNYSTKAIGLNFDHFFRNGDRLNIFTSFMKYNASFEDVTFNQQFEFENGMNQYMFKSSYERFYNNWFDAELGIDLSYYNFITGQITPIGSESNIKKDQLSNEKSLETAIYLQNTINIADKLSIGIGVRFSSYFNIGPTEYFEFGKGLGISRESVIDTLSISPDKIQHLKSTLEPRLTLNYQLNISTSIKAGYSQTAQYMHLFSNSVASLPTDLWRSSTPNLKPMFANQVSLGLFKNFQDNTLRMSTEIFYKQVNNTVDFKNGTSILMNRELTFNTLQGESKSYGAEFLIEKKGIWYETTIAYTLSKSQSIVKNVIKEEQINDGQYFPSNFDKPHDINAFVNFKLSRLWSMSANFVYSSGRPATIPQSTFFFDGLRYFTDIERNNFRVPDTHRLDISFTIEGNNKVSSKFESSWTFSVYNVYGRKNPFSIFVVGDSLKAKQLSVFGAPFPSITFNLKTRN